MDMKLKGTSNEDVVDSDVLKLERERKDEELFATRLSNFVPAENKLSKSSFEGVGVGGGVRGKSSDFWTVTCRMRETEIVASDAISFTRDDERGLVVKTTKKGRVSPRLNFDGLGKVIWNKRPQISIQT